MKAAGFRHIALGGAFPLCDCKDWEVDGVGFRLGPPRRMLDGLIHLPCWAWDAFTGESFGPADFALNPSPTAGSWSVSAMLE